MYVIFDELWFLTTGPPAVIFAEFSEWKNCQCIFLNFTNKSNSLTCTVASSFVYTSPLAVTTVVGLPIRLLLNMCIDARESTTNSLCSSFTTDGAGRHHSLANEKKVALSFFFERKDILGLSHASPRTYASCLSVSSWDLSSNFKAYTLRWWGTLTCVLFSDGPLFSLMLAWRCVAFVNRTRRVDPKTFVLFRENGKDSGGSLSRNSQPKCRASFNIVSALFVTILFLFFAGMTFNLTVWNEHLLPNLDPDSDLQNWHSGGCQWSQGDLVQILFK